MNRNYYCKVNSQEEANKLLKKLRDVGEDTDRYHYTDRWQYIVYDKKALWALSNIETFKEEFKGKIEVPSSELIDYVTGKKLNKDALLEEAKRRYPIGTKFKSALKGDKHPFQTIVKENIYLDKVDGRQVIWNGDGCGFIYDDENWAEIVEEPKVETKFEKGKWYYYEHGENGKDKYYLKYDKHNSGKFYYIEYIKLMKNAKAIRQVSDVPFKFMYNIKEVPLSEIQQYLPDGHPDKIKQEVKEEVKPNITWKIGDYVVFVEDWCFSKKGDIDKIKELGTRVTALYLKKEGLAGSPLYKECKLKVFPTLQEAQKFSDELLGKSKAGLRVEDLVEGEIYVNGPDNGTTWCYIIKYSKNSSKKAVGLYKTGVYSAEYCNYMGDYTEGWLLRLATPDEKKWLNTCIKQDKFIEQSELNKYDDEGNLMEKNEEYPEYVKLINIGGCIGETAIINRIYKLVKDNRGNYQYEFLLDNVYKFGFDDRNGKFTKYFEPSTKEDYEAQFKKDDKFKNGDWLVYIGDCGCKPSTPIKIGDVRQMIEGRFGSLAIYGTKDLSQYFRKALPHEIPLENNIKQYPYTPEESLKLDFEVKWKEPRYIGGVDPISAFSWGIFEQMKKQSPQCRKTPDLIDKSKVKVEIKRTKVKQIKL